MFFFIIFSIFRNIIFTVGLKPLLLHMSRSWLWMCSFAQIFTKTILQLIINILHASIGLPSCHSQLFFFSVCLSSPSFFSSHPSPSLLLLTTCAELMDCFGWTPTTECHLISVPLNMSYIQQNVIGSPLLLPPASSVEASMNGQMCMHNWIYSLSLSILPSLFLFTPLFLTSDGYKKAWTFATATVGSGRWWPPTTSCTPGPD